MIVGAGPGDPTLITVKALETIKAADVIVYDRLIPTELLSHAKPGAIKIYVGKEPQRHEMSQEEINELLMRLAREDKLVVRLKGGDPYTFGRGEEECEFLLSNNVECEVVPGIPSFVGASAYAGIPLAGRSFASSFAVITGHLAEGKDMKEYLGRVRSLAQAADMLVILMGVKNLDLILSEIAKVRGWDEPAAAVMWATTERQLTVAGTMSSLLDAWRRGVIINPAVIYVGRGVNKRVKLWRRGAEYSTWGQSSQQR
ncbi:Uroporphyrin-III C-methyltransferase [Acidilobus saccharovorans 345-15]|uniref:uroporphyrinogen-III C-methyltransferase n=1 Tax=Acidilobus saccharovorans (strain DSM 16705 / JCM 18335 / VKM B-2471 / 345-15) TaxID=666510 RepID=D9Q2R9_ACIS3|nr:Uroporphyrin-III C-methyltransferase [Acidilobus saccharovorans 345-15]